MEQGSKGGSVSNLLHIWAGVKLALFFYGNIRARF